MYSDPTLVRSHRVPINLSDSEFELVQAIVKYTGQQRGTLLRELMLEQASRLLAGVADFAPAGHESEGLQAALQFSDSEIKEVLKSA